MESFIVSNLVSATPTLKSGRATRRKVNGEATAALLIQMASEILATSPTMRKRMNVSLTDLAAADKVRKGLTRKSGLLP